MEIQSKVADTKTLDLFDNDVEEVSTISDPSQTKTETALSTPSVRKSAQGYAHDESLEGLKDKYVNTSQGIDGFEDSIYLPNGEEVSGIWRLVDAFSVSPSHDPFSFHSTKGFPRSAEGSSANTRDYYNEPAAQMQVTQLAGDFDGRALGYDTAVVVTKDGVVISGNNRTMSSQLAARKGTDKRYIDALIKRCRSFGFTPEQVQAFEHPRVVFEIDSQDYSPEHFDKYNQSDKKEQSEEARIVRFSKVVKSDVLRDIADLASRYQFDLGRVYATLTSCEELMSIFIKNKVFSQAELPKYFDGMYVSSVGKQFVTEYILGGILNESVIRALYSEGMGNLKQAVLGSAQLLLENWANGSFSVIDELNAAIRYAISFITEVNNGKFVVPKIGKDESKSMTADDKVAHNLKAFNVWASQGDLLEDRHPLVLKLAGALVYSVSLFKDYLTRLNEATASAAKTERETEESGNSGLFGDEEDFTPDRYGLLEKAVASWQRRNFVKRNILSSVLRSDLMANNKTMVRSGYPDFKSVAQFKRYYMDSAMVATTAIQKLQDLGLSYEEAERKIRDWGYERRHSFNSSVIRSGLTGLGLEMDTMIYEIKDLFDSHQISNDEAGRRLSALGLSDSFVYMLVMDWMRSNEARLASGYSPHRTGKSQALFQDLKNKIMKWTNQDPNNKKAYQQAIQLYRDNFGKNPETEKDARLIMKTAKQMAKTGQVYDDASFKQEAQQVMGGQEQQQNQTQQSGGFQGNVDASDPVALFKAIQALYKEGSISKEQVEKAFKMVTGGQGSQRAYNMPDQTQGEKMAASLKRVSSGKNPGVRFDRLPKGVTGLQVGSRVIFTPLQSSKDDLDFVSQKDALYAGKTGVIRTIKSDIYNVEMPEEDGVPGEVISAYSSELSRVALDEEILSARGAISDPMREWVQQFLYNIPSFTKVPAEFDRRVVTKEVLEPDHVCYWYSETIDNGKPYTVEFHTCPGEPFCDVYVVRDFDNHPLDEGGYHIEDFEDWNLSEVDYVEGLFAKEKASTGSDASFDKTKSDMRTGDYQDHPHPNSVDDDEEDLFSNWSARVGAGLSLGKGMSLPDMAIVSGLARVLSSGFTEGYNKTLDVVDTLVHDPLKTLDDVSALPFKLLDKVTGRKKNRVRSSRLGFKKPIASAGNGLSSIDALEHARRHYGSVDVLYKQLDEGRTAPETALDGLLSHGVDYEAALVIIEDATGINLSEEGGIRQSYTPLHSKGRSRIMSARGLISKAVDSIFKTVSSYCSASTWRRSVQDLPEATLDDAGNVQDLSIFCVVTNPETGKSSNICIKASSGRGLRVGRW